MERAVLEKYILKSLQISILANYIIFLDLLLQH